MESVSADSIGCLNNHDKDLMPSSPVCTFLDPNGALEVLNANCPGGQGNGSALMSSVGIRSPCLCVMIWNQFDACMPAPLPSNRASVFSLTVVEAELRDRPQREHGASVSSTKAGNQRGFAKGLQASGVPREEVFVCGSVVSNRARGASSQVASNSLGCECGL